MTDQTLRSPGSQAGLEVAQEFIRAVEAKDLNAVAATLNPQVRQLFMHTTVTTSPEGVKDIIASRRRGLCVADMNGKKDVLAYTDALFAKFSPLIWRDHQWVISSAGEVFFHGVGGMALARNGRTYRNSYVTRFDIVEDQITVMAEYGNAFLYAGLGVRPNGAEFRGLLRAIGRLLNPTMSARSGR